MTQFDWLPERSDWDELLSAARKQSPAEALATFQGLANSRIDFVRTAKLARAVQRYVAAQPGASFPNVRIALLGSSTLGHLVPGIRVGCLRRGILADIYEGPYGLFRQELADSQALRNFNPQIVLLALDAHYLTGADSISPGHAVEMMRACWRDALHRFQCALIQQTVLPCVPGLMGSNEHRYPESPRAAVQTINQRLREIAADNSVHLLAIDDLAIEEGLNFWHDPALWHRAKQEVHPRASSLYGEYTARLISALRGKSFKCLVLDLDNTLWGGVVGDDGLDGLILANGNAIGEAHLALQRYAQRLARRGVILAVCSKNDHANAILPFEHHPEMILKLDDVSVFAANWNDKAANIRAIAETLNIGLDSLVFVDDNPAERGLVRRELPMVAVPELPEDSAGFTPCLARAGYFEALSVTDEDRDRTSQYRANVEREKMRASSTDIDSFLSQLNMELIWGPFHATDFARVVQLINKTNQFNLTTRRYLESEVQALMSDDRALTLQMRLTDVYGDNGIIAILIAKLIPPADLEIDTWLMSCRVLGRQVEQATLNVLAQQALALGATRLVGDYRPTAKNGMVREHYQRLGFELLRSSSDGLTRWAYPLVMFQPTPTHIRIRERADAKLHLQAAH